jgi:hypothetical protein
MRWPGDEDELITRSRSDFYLKVSIGALVLLGIALCQAWVLEFYYHQPVISTMSFRGYDPSWIPRGTSFSSALGSHYFGDFEQYMGYVQSHAPPYSSAVQYPAAYGPISIVLVKTLSFIFGWPGAVLVFLPVTLLFLLWGLARLLGGFLSARLLAVLLLFTAGIVICLDRGNLQLLVAALCVWFCVGLLEDRPTLMIATLAVAISMKLYVAVLLLVLLRQRRWRDTTLVIGVAVAIDLVCFALVGGGYISNISNYIHTDFLFASSLQRGFMLGCVSAASVVYKGLFLLWGPSHFVAYLRETPSWYVQVPGVVSAALCIAVIWLTRRPREYMLIAALALMQLGPASTYPYVEINTVIELALLMRVVSAPPVAGTHNVPDGDPVVSRRVLLTCVVLLLLGSAPWPGRVYGLHGTNTPMTWLVSPVASLGVVIVLLVGLTIGVLRRRREVEAPLTPALDSEEDSRPSKGRHVKPRGSPVGQSL